MRDFIKLMSVLFIACGLAAGSLAVVNAVTKERIANYEKLAKEDAFREVSAGADEFVVVTPDKVWEAFRKKAKAGHVFLTQVQGYGGPIKMAFGTGLDGAITGLQVLNHTETPGLGAKITTPQFRDQFKGKLLGQIVLKKDDSTNGKIDAITGATITSRAVTQAMRTALEGAAKGPAANDEKAQQEAAFREVAPGADEFVVVTPDKVWEAFRKKAKAGHVFLTHLQGYCGPITLAFGTDAAGVVTGLRILNQCETAGFGAEIAGPQFTDQFKNKRLEQIVLKKDDPAKGGIDAITGATNTSRAVTEAVYLALDSFIKEKTGEAK